MYLLDHGNTYFVISSSDVFLFIRPFPYTGWVPAGGIPCTSLSMEAPTTACVVICRVLEFIISFTSAAANTHIIFMLLNIKIIPLNIILVPINSIITLLDSINMPLNSIIMLHTCAVEAVFCYTAENSHHLKAQVT